MRLYYLSVIVFVIALCTSVCASGANAVGAIPGQFNVSATGAATYEIPIECPTGVGGLKPELTFVYNSQLGDGLMGRGWTIGGLSAITRVPKTKFYDGKIAGVEFTKDDALALDGVRLVKVTASSDYTEFRLENDIYTRIIGYEPQDQGFKYFKVHTKDGRVLTLGSPEGDGSNYGWPLTEICDANGNYITFQDMTSYGGDIASGVGRVTYGMNKSGDGRKIVIEFEFETSPNPVTQYVCGKVINKWARVKRVRVLENGVMNIGEYTISYMEGSRSSDHSRLSAISYEKEGTSVGSTTFDWTTPQYRVKCISNPVSSSEEFWQKLKCISYGDMDGDGEIEWASYSDGELRIGKGADIWNYTSISIKQVSSLNFYDVDKDGVDELIVGYWHCKDHKVRHRVVKKNPETGNLDWDVINLPWDTTVKVDDGYSSRNGNFTDGRVQDLVGDFYGDGTLQFIPTCSPYRNTWHPREYAYREVIHKASGRYPDVSRISDEFAYTYVTDVNGNGKSDIVRVYGDGSVRIYEEKNGAFEELMPAGFSVSRTNDILNPGDFNGDGNTDFLILRNCGGKSSVEYYISTGKKLVRSNGCDDIKTGNNANLSILDVNMDGRSDVYVCDRGKASLYLSTGSNFIKVSETSNPVLSREVLDDDADMYQYSPLAICAGSNGNPYRCVETLHGEVELSPNIFPDRIVRIEDGLHNTVKVEYAVNRNLHVPERINDVVAKSTMYNSTGVGDISIYDYKDVLYDKESERFAGYGMVSKTNEASGRKTVNRYSLNHSTVQLDRTDEIVGGTNVKTVTYNYKLEPYGRSLTNLITKETEHDWLTGLEKSIEYQRYDQYGNIQKVVAKNGGQTVTQEITYTRFGLNCFKPSSINITCDYAGNTISKSCTLKYDDKWNLVSENENGKVKNYAYDTFGNCIKMSYGSNSLSRSEKYTYTESGRHIKTKTNALGEKTVYRWNETKCQLTSEIDSDKRYTYYYYDELGRLRETISPSGVTEYEERQWAEQGNPYGASYMTVCRSSRSGGQTTWFTSDGREVCKKQKGLGGKDVYVVKEYNKDGTLRRVSKPSYESQPTEWAEEYEYDSYGRVVKVTTPEGVTTTSYTGLTQTIKSPEYTIVKTFTKEGLTESVSTNGKTVRYTYYPDGNLKTATPDGGAPVYMEYDKWGNRTKITDAESGTVTRKYNVFGELTESSHKQGGGVTVTTAYTYSSEGLLIQKNRGGDITNYMYDSSNRLISKTQSGGVSQSYEYDKYDRIIRTVDKIDGKAFARETSYDSEGRVRRETYPSGYYTENVYDENGVLALVKDKDGREIYEPIEADASGNIVKESRGGKVTTYTFDNIDRLTSIVCDGIINHTYTYDVKGNLSKFTDNLSSQSCNYTYDALNRLAEWNAYGVDTANPVVTDKITYDESNNMVRKSSLGDMILAYEDANHPHAVSSISGVPSSFPKDEQSITYTNFNKVESVSQGDMRYDITYGVGEQRIKSEYANAQGKTIRYYIGNYEEVTDPDGTVTKYCYLPGGAMMVEKNGEQKLYYNYTDRLGSIVATADAEGNVIERYAYDPWGGRLNPDNWEEKDTRTSLFNNRGYTGHEHIDGLDLINMNGRMYDPLLGMFMSTDPFIQDPDNWLNYNRYLYGFGNPMKYIDPSGNIGILAAIGIGAFVGAAIGAGLGTWYGYNQGYTGKDLTRFALAGVCIGAVVGAVSGAFMHSSISSLIAAKTFWNFTMTGATIGESVGLVGGMAYGLANKATGWDLANCALTGSGIGFVAGAIIGAGCYGLYSWCVASAETMNAETMGYTVSSKAYHEVMNKNKHLANLTGSGGTKVYNIASEELKDAMKLAGVNSVEETKVIIKNVNAINRLIREAAQRAVAYEYRRVATISAIVGTVGASGILAGAGYGYYQLTNLWLKD